MEETTTQVLVDDHKNLELGPTPEGHHECTSECDHEHVPAPDVFPIILLGDENDAYLKAKAHPIPEVNDEVRAFCDGLLDTMKAYNGLGIAAPQVGVSGRILIVRLPEVVPTRLGPREMPRDPKVFINPEVVSSEGTQRAREGCLSLPGVTAYVERPNVLKVKATNLEGEEFEVTVEGWGASLLAHELDHLDGVLLFDRIPAQLSRKRALAKYAKSRRALFRGAGRVVRSRKASQERTSKARKKRKRKKR